MGYRVMADAVLILHLGFILWVLLGALAVWQRPWLALCHLPACVWGTLVELNAWLCPLTPLENRLRQWGGEAGIGESFIAHYLLPILYPTGLTPAIQWWLGVIVVALNGGLYAAMLYRRWQRRRPD
ncbi:DUF2784 domain-containing protein [Salinicola aestuarinus]|uniref:DUF2784 domain-containing protein n=1 Tax=Salinicola aestuarinus TaxID=1949082 RepID=UPI000DA1A183|nr:DUF2784 domain-containing protein [Salinicola aestuarinus]